MLVCESFHSRKSSFSIYIKVMKSQNMNWLMLFIHIMFAVELKDLLLLKPIQFYPQNLIHLITIDHSMTSGSFLKVRLSIKREKFQEYMIFGFMHDYHIISCQALSKTRTSVAPRPLCSSQDTGRVSPFVYKCYSRTDLLSFI